MKAFFVSALVGLAADLVTAVLPLIWLITPPSVTEEQGAGVSTGHYSRHHGPAVVSHGVHAHIVHVPHHTVHPRQLPRPGQNNINIKVSGSIIATISMVDQSLTLSGNRCLIAAYFVVALALFLYPRHELGFKLSACFEIGFL